MDLGANGNLLIKIKLIKLIKLRTTRNTGKHNQRKDKNVHLTTKNEGYKYTD